MRRLLFASLFVFALAGCGGSGSNGTAPRLAGSYEGTWVNVDDAEDAGVSSWTIAENGAITGTDIDVSQEFQYTVFGNVDSAGNVDATTSRIGADEVIGLAGRLQFDDESRLTGTLVWDSEPPLTYRYTFARQP